MAGAELVIRFDTDGELAEYVRKLKQAEIERPGATWSKRRFGESFTTATAYVLRRPTDAQ